MSDMHANFYAMASDVDAWATRCGFAKSIPFQGAKTAVGDPTVRYAGFYLLEFQDGDWYLGESINVRGRLGQHKLTYGDDVASVRLLLQNLSKPALRARETKLIHELDGKVPGKVRNKAGAGISAGSNELVDFLDETEQQRWFDDPIAFNAADNASLKALITGQEVKYKTAAKRFRELPNARELTDVLRSYLERCVPAPRRTEFQSWNVSCGTYNWNRAYCVSVGKMESFVVRPDGEGFIVVRKSVLLPGVSARGAFRLRHPDVHIDTTSPYEDSGPDMARLFATTNEDLQALLDDPTVQLAAATLVLDVMRKHPSVYSRYHCTQLVEDVYSEYRRPAAEAPLELTDAKQLVAELTEEAARDVDDLLDDTDEAPEKVVEQPDDVPLFWFVNAGPKATKRNTIADFQRAGEWRMDPNERYEAKVLDMLPGERIAVRKRYNTKKDIPFDHRDNLVSCMDILLTGTIAENPGDGVSVKVDWDPMSAVRTWYLFTSQDTVWPVSPVHLWSRRLIDFAFGDGRQDINFWRNAYFWQDRFGDR